MKISSYPAGYTRRLVFSVVCLFAGFIHASFVYASERPDFSAMQSWGGGLMDGHDIQYGYAVYHDGKTTWLVLELLSRYEGNKAVWEYVHHIRVPEHNEETHHLTFLSCLDHGIHDSRIAAIVKHENVDEIKNLQHAWRADLEKKKIVRISTSGISCINEGYNI